MHIGLNERKRILNHYLGPALTFIPPSLLHLWLTCFILGMHTLYNDLAQDCAGLIGICRRDHGNCMNVTQWRGSLPLSDVGVGRSVGSCAHYAHCIGKPACAFHLHSECDTLLFFSFLFKRQDARIIVGLFYETEARKVFCEVISYLVHLWQTWLAWI